MAYLLVLVSVVIALYFNTFGHEYALDDYIVIKENRYTKKGFAGIKDLATRDMMQGFFGEDKQLLEGGRYRPLSLITFAVEWELWGESPHFSHVINVLLYAWLVGLLFQLWRLHLFPGRNELAFLAALIFAIHPLHTEVVANIKSRDEILSLILLTVTTIYFLKYVDGRKFLNMAAALALFLLALLAKENGLTYLVLLPLTVYFFRQETFVKSWRWALPLLGVVFVYALMRAGTAGFATSGGSTDVMNNPYIKADFIEKYASIFVVLGKYFVMLVWPHPLSWDYSYQFMPYQSLTSPWLWLSLAALISVLAVGFRLTTRKSPYAYAILYYYLSLFIVSNLLLNVGATMADRFLFQPSIGFALAAALGLQALGQASFATPQVRKFAALGILAAGISLAAAKTFTRNVDWKNNETLYIHDVEIAPNSAKANLGAGEAYFHLAIDSLRPPSEAQKLAYFKKGLTYFDKALEIYPDYNDPYLRKIVTYIFMDDFENAARFIPYSRRLYPTNEKLLKYQKVVSGHYFNQAVAERKAYFTLLGAHNIPEADEHLRRAVDLIQQKVLPVYDAEMEYYGELGNLYGQMMLVDSSAAAFREAVRLEPGSAASWFGLGVTYMRGGRYAEAVQPLKQAAALGYREAAPILNDAVKFSQAPAAKPAK